MSNKRTEWLEFITRELAYKVAFFVNKPFFKEEYTIERTFVTIDVDQMEQFITHIEEELKSLKGDENTQTPPENPNQLRLFE